MHHMLSSPADKLSQLILNNQRSQPMHDIIKMETEYYSGVNWASPTDHAESLFPWETESPRSGQADVLGSELDLLLSASSYPMPDPPQEDQQQENGLAALYGGVIAHEEDASNESALFQPTPETRNPNPPSNRMSKTAEARKRGRPRKLIDDAGVNAEEVREASNLRGPSHLTDGSDGARKSV